MTKKLLYAIPLLFSFLSSYAQQSIGEWQAHLSYHEATRSEPAGNVIYVLSSGSLFSYDREDTSIQLFHKANMLNDTDISTISYHSQHKTLLIVYSNANIDLLVNNQNVYNLPDYMNKIMTYEKDVNSISFAGDYAYLSTSFGIITINLKKKEISNTYILNKKVNATAVEGDNLYAATTEGLYLGLLTDNLLDIKNWKKISDAVYLHISSLNNELIGNIAENGIYQLNKYNYSHNLINKGNYLYMNRYNDKILAGNQNNLLIMDAVDKTNSVNLERETTHISFGNNTYWGSYGSTGFIGHKYNTNNNTLEDIILPVIPNSPRRNLPYYMTFAGERLLIAGGSLNYVGIINPGTLMAYENGRWENFQEEGISEITGKNYRNLTCIIQDPRDPEHHFATSARYGLYEFRNKKFVKLYSIDNSGLESIFVTNSDFVSTNGPIYDKNMNLWMVNNRTPSIIKILKPDGSWHEFNHPEISQIETFERCIFDRRGWLWINSMWNNEGNDVPGFYCFNYNNTIENTTDDQTRFIRSLPNQEGTTITMNHCYCIVEDKNGTIWVGTDKGPLVLTNPANVFNDNFYCTQIKVPRNDGSGLADFLLANEEVIAIAIDGANRKWIGTRNSGIYLVSEDGLETIHHFTRENSPLLSNYIQSIAINPVNGIVYIGTDKGLISYRSDATEAEETFADEVYAFPNPVRPDYSGVITVKGLVRDSDVKITDAKGTLIYAGTSVGGQFTWDGKNRRGNRVASGVYFVLAANSQGTEGIVTKIVVIK